MEHSKADVHNSKEGSVGLSLTFSVIGSRPGPFSLAGLERKLQSWVFRNSEHLKELWSSLDCSDVECRAF